MARYVKDKEDLAIMRRLGVALATARLDFGWTQTELADEVGLSRASIANIERGAQMPTIRTMSDLCFALETNPNNVLGWG